MTLHVLHEFEVRMDRTWDAQYFCPKLYLNQNYNISNGLHTTLALDYGHITSVYSRVAVTHSCCTVFLCFLLVNMCFSCLSCTTAHQTWQVVITEAEWLHVILLPAFGLVKKSHDVVCVFFICLIVGLYVAMTVDFFSVRLLLRNTTYPTFTKV